MVGKWRWCAVAGFFLFNAFPLYQRRLDSEVGGFTSRGAEENWVVVSVLREEMMGSCFL
jgi:hypothetical protein